MSTSGRLALVVWDMQRGIAPAAFNYPEVSANIKRLLEGARRAGIPVLFSQHTGLPYPYMSGYARESLRRRGMDPRGGVYMAEGSPEWGFVEGVSPQPGEIVVKKHTPSLFVGTYVEQLLRNAGVGRLLITGVATEVGVAATAWHAAALGFIPIVVEDAVGGRSREAHQAILGVMRQLFVVVNTSEALKMIGEEGST